MTTILETKRMRLREFTQQDLDDLAVMLADEEHMRFYSRPKTRAEAATWIDWNLDLYSRYGFGLWVMESKATEEFLGQCGLTPQTVDGVTDIELGWHTVTQHANRGLATEAALACRDKAFSEFGISRLISIIDPANQSSCRVAEKVGMRVEKTTIRDGKPTLIYVLEKE